MSEILNAEKYAQSHTADFISGLTEGQAVVTDLLAESDYDIRALDSSAVGNRLHEYKLARMANTGQLFPWDSNDAKLAFEIGIWTGVEDSTDRFKDQYDTGKSQ